VAVALVRDMGGCGLAKASGCWLGLRKGCLWLLVVMQLAVAGGCTTRWCTPVVAFPCLQLVQHPAPVHPSTGR